MHLILEKKPLRSVFETQISMFPHPLHSEKVHPKAVFQSNLRSKICSISGKKSLGSRLLYCYASCFLLFWGLKIVVGFLSTVFWRCFTGNKKQNPVVRLSWLVMDVSRKKGGQLNLLTCYFFHLSGKAVDFSELLVIFASTHLLGKISYLKHVFLMYWKTTSSQFRKTSSDPPWQDASSRMVSQ